MGNQKICNTIAVNAFNCWSHSAQSPLSPSFWLIEEFLRIFRQTGDRIDPKFAGLTHWNCAYNWYVELFFALSNLSCKFPLWIHVSMLPLSWWRHQRETLSALLSLCVGNAPVNSPHKDQWRGALMFCLICAWRNGVNNREAGDLRRHRDHYDVTLMILELVYIYLHACMYRVRACGLKAANKKSDSKSEHIIGLYSLDQLLVSFPLFSDLWLVGKFQLICIQTPNWTDLKFGGWIHCVHGPYNGLHICLHLVIKGLL